MRALMEVQEEGRRIEERFEQVRREREAELTPPRKLGPFPPCYVYAIRRRDTREVKLGVSIEPARRLRAIQTAHGAPLEMVIVGVGGATVEQEIHRRFAAHRKLGEWFHEAPEITAWIEASSG